MFLDWQNLEFFNFLDILINNMWKKKSTLIELQFQLWLGESFVPFLKFLWGKSV